MCLIVAGTLLALGRVCTFGFTVWDDSYNVSQNPRLSPPTFEGIGHYWRAPAMALYIPLTYTAWGLLALAAYRQAPDPAGSHLNPSVFHAANLVVHLAAALAVYSLLNRLLKRPWAACIGALVFALHPLQVEPVGWVAGFKDVLAGCLGLWAIALYLRGADDSRSRLYYAASLSLLGLALLSKPSAMVIPAIALALEWLLLSHPLKSATLRLAPWFVLALAGAVMAKLVQPATGVQTASLWSRPLIAGDALAFYLYKLLVPVQLGIDYGRRPQDVLAQPWAGFAWLVPVALFGILWLTRRQSPALLAAGAVFLVGVLPVLGFVPFEFQHISTVADHYLYIAMLGPALAVAALVARISRVPAMLAGAAVALVLGSLSFAQSAHWRDGFALFTHALEVNPHSAPAMNNLANEILLPGSAREPREALHYTQRAYDLMSRTKRYEAGVVDTHGYALVLSGRVEEGIAVLQFARSLQPLPDIDYHLGEAYLRLGARSQAAQMLQSALRTIEMMEQQNLAVDPSLPARVQRALQQVR